MEILAHTLAELESLHYDGDIDAVNDRVEALASQNGSTPMCGCADDCAWDSLGTLDDWLGTLPADPEGESIDWDAIDRAWDAYKDTRNGL